MDTRTTKVLGIGVAFANPTGSWGAVSHYGWFTALTGGVPAYFNPLDTLITITTGTIPVQFEAGSIVMDFA